MKRVAAMALAKKQNEGLIFENSTGSTVNDILPDDEANETFDEIDGNITGVEWEAEAETQEPATHTLQTYNNQYAALADEEENEDNDNESTGVDNDGKITGVRHDNEITGVDSDNKRTESGSTGKNDEADELALIEEAIAEAERDIAEATDLLEGTETENDEARNENVIHPSLQVPTVEHAYNLWRRKHPRLDYTNRYGFQATIIHCALTQLSMKCELKKFKKRQKHGNCRTKTNPQERRILTSQNRKYNIKAEARVACPANFPKRKARRVNKGTWSSGWDKTTGENRTKGRDITNSLDRSSHSHSNN